MLLAQKLLAAGGIGLRYVGGAAASFNTPSSISLTSLTGGIDSRPRAGDIVIVAAGGGDPDNPNITTTGYTEIADLYAGNSINNGANLAVAWKLMTSTPDTSVSVDTNVNDGASVYAIHVWRGVDQVTPLDVTPTTTTASGTAPNAPSITPTTVGAVVLAIGGVNGGTVVSFQTRMSAMSAPSGMSRLASAAGNTSDSNPNGAFALAIAAVRWTSGAYDPAAFVGGTYADFDYSCSLTLALRPAS